MDVVIELHFLGSPSTVISEGLFLGPELTEKSPDPSSVVSRP